MKPHLALALSAFVLAITGADTSPAIAAPPVYVNGVLTQIDAVERGRQVFVPVRGVFEKLGTAVIYTPPSSVVARKAHVDLAQLKLGSRQSIVNGKPHTLSNAPFRLGSHVYVPLRLISQAAGATVVYTTAPHAVKITAARPAAVAISPGIAATPVPATVPAQAGMPWWVWPLIALLILAAILAFFARRRKSAVLIKTRSSAGDPTIRTRQ